MGTYCVKQTNKMKPTKQVRKINICHGFSILYKLIELLSCFTKLKHLITTIYYAYYVYNRMCMCSDQGIFCDLMVQFTMIISIEANNI